MYINNELTNSIALYIYTSVPSALCPNVRKTKIILSDQSSHKTHTHTHTTHTRTSSVYIHTKFGVHIQQRATGEIMRVGMIKRKQSKVHKSARAEAKGEYNKRRICTSKKIVSYVYIIKLYSILAKSVWPCVLSIKKPFCPSRPSVLRAAYMPARTHREYCGSSSSPSPDGSVSRFQRPAAPTFLSPTSAPVFVPRVLLSLYTYYTPPRGVTLAQYSLVPLFF